jgi:hypothetical protein
MEFPVPAEHATYLGDYEFRVVEMGPCGKRNHAVHRLFAGADLSGIVAQPGNPAVGNAVSCAGEHAWREIYCDNTAARRKSPEKRLCQDSRAAPEIDDHFVVADTEVADSCIEQVRKRSPVAMVAPGLGPRIEVSAFRAVTHGRAPLHAAAREHAFLILNTRIVDPRTKLHQHPADGAR